MFAPQERSVHAIVSVLTRPFPHRSPPQRSRSQRCSPERIVVVKRLETNTNEKSLRQTFGVFGPIVSATVKTYNKYGTKYGLVFFGDAVSARKALTSYFGAMEVDYFYPRPEARGCSLSRSPSRSRDRSRGRSQNRSRRQSRSRSRSRSRGRSPHPSRAKSRRTSRDRSRGRSRVRPTTARSRSRSRSRGRSGRYSRGRSPARSRRRSPPPDTRRTNNKLIVRQLTDEFDSVEKLSQLFKHFGEVVSTEIDTSQTEPIGNVWLADSRAGDMCCEVLNGMLTKSGQSLLVSNALSVDNSSNIQRSGVWRVIVSGLDKEVTDTYLTNTFNIYGPVLYARVVTDKSGQRTGYGSVVYPSEQNARKAIEAKGTVRMFGKSVNIVMYDHYRHRPLLDGQSVSHRKQIYLKNLDKAYDSEEKLKGLCLPYGSVTKARVIKHTNGKNNGFGFVKFADNAMAEKACTHLNGLDLSGTELRVWIDINDEINDSLHSKNDSIECQLCLSGLTADTARGIRCSHPFCANCIRQFFIALIKNGSVDELKCPDRTCLKTADQQIVNRYVSPQMLLKFDRSLNKPTIKVKVIDSRSSSVVKTDENQVSSSNSDLDKHSNMVKIKKEEEEDEIVFEKEMIKCNKCLKMIEKPQKINSVICHHCGQFMRWPK